MFIIFIGLFLLIWIASGNFWIAVAVMASIFIFFIILLSHVTNERHKQIGEAKCTIYQSFKEFNKARQNYMTFSGVYVLKNLTLNKNYVGQSVDVHKRVASHFMGRGNGDVYADYKYGNKFEIILIPFQEPWKSLNSMERDMIDYYNAERGYNKTKGNRG